MTHEVGHTHGLGHFGGPNVNQPFKLQPNGRVFDPEAVMNPFYLGGEKRDLLQTDIADYGPCTLPRPSSRSSCLAQLIEVVNKKARRVAGLLVPSELR